MSLNDNEIMPLSEAGKERLKLKAEFINGIALNLMAIGTFGPLAAWIFFEDLAKDREFLAAAFGIFCFLGSFALHFVASALLRDIDQ